MLELTYIVFALALAYLLDLPVVYAMIGSVLPNVDMLFNAPFPFVPQGILHTPLFAVTVLIVVYLATDRGPVALAAGVGVLSHLFLDTLTALGVMWLYPVSTGHVAFNLFPATSLSANVAVIAYSVLVTVVWRYRAEVRRWTRR